MRVGVAEAELLREENAELRAALAQRDAAIAAKDADLAKKDETIAARDEALARMAKKLRLTAEERDYLKRRFFGRTSETFLEGPALFEGLGAPEPMPPAQTAPDDEGSTLSEREKKQSKSRPAGRRRPPEHLPRVRIEHPLDESQKHCGACGSERVRIGEETSETVEYVPARYEAHVHVRGKYACRCGEGGVVTPPAPPRPIPGSYASPSLLAKTLAAKYVDHLPLYRQAEIFRREGFDLARSTLCDWVGGVMPLLEPVALEIRRSVLSGGYVQADETPLTVQEGREGRPKEAYLWAYRSPATGEIAFDFRMGRGREGPSEVLAGFRGTLQTDAYAGYDEAVRDNALVAVGCWAHARRKHYEALESSPKEAALVLVAIRRLYKIEERLAGLADEERLRVRTAETRPALAEIKELVEAFAKDVTPSSRLGKACSYTLSQWKELTAFADDPRVAVDNNGVERHMKAVATGRKNWLFAGNEAGGRRAAVMYSLVESCRAVGVEPFAYLADLLTRLPAARQSGIASFTPRNWAAARRA
jgi:transposase